MAYRRSHSTLALVQALIALISGGARASEDAREPEENESAALAARDSVDEEERLIHAGVQLRHAGRDGEALDRFRRAVALRRSPRSLAQAGLAAHAVGSLAEAEASLVEALDATQDPWIVQWRPLLEESLERARQGLATLVLSTDRGDAELWIDGERIGSPNPAGQRVTAGTHRVELRVPDRPPMIREVRLVAGTTRKEAIFSPPPPNAGASGVPPKPEHSATPPKPEASTTPQVSESRAALSTHQVLAWTMIGGGAVSLSLAVVAHVSYAKNRADYNDDSRCLVPGYRRDQVCGDSRARAEGSRYLAVVGYGVAGSLGASALILFLTDGGSKRERATHPTLAFDARGVLAGYSAKF